MELHELHIGHRDTGTQRHGHAVARGFGRVRGEREQLAGAARSQKHVARAQYASTGSLTNREAYAAMAIDHQVTREHMLVHDRGSALGRSHQRALDLCARGGAACVHDARVAVATFARQLQRAVRIAVEAGP